MTAKFSVTPRTQLIDPQSGKPTRDLLGLLNYLNSVAADVGALVIEDSITNGVTDKAPSENAVYDALASRDTTIATLAAALTALTTVVGTKISTALTLTGTAAYDPPSLADGAGTTTTVTVTGAALGDVALASFSLDTSGITITAWVSAANTVSVRFQNESGGLLDIGSGTLKAAILR